VEGAQGAPGSTKTEKNANGDSVPQKLSR
jgi:hypothetical protein